MRDALDPAEPEPGDPARPEPTSTARQLAEQATSLLLSRPAGVGRTRVGVVDGPSGSGKSTFARVWEQVLLERGTVFVFLFSSDLLATWADPFGWFDRFDDGVLAPLGAGRPGRVQLTDWTAGPPRPGSWLEFPVVDVLLLEGVSAGRSALGNRVGVSVWLEGADRAERLERAVARDGESSRVNLSRWQDAEDGFFERDRPADRADFIARSLMDAPLVQRPAAKDRKVASRLPRGMLAP
jgi:energy-coupling factor transporter ATP-binding protein EcfA2